MPAPHHQPTGSRSPASREREFVRGNRNGPGRSNDSYTVCRLRVPQARLDEEMSLGMHSHFVSASDCWDCPAHIFLKAEQKWRRRRGIQDQRRYSPPSAVELKRWLATDRQSTGTEALEIIHRDGDSPEDAPTYTICRVAVPRETLVREVKAGLHPRYHVRTSRRGDYVQGNPTEAFDNANYPEGRRPGFAPSELCPFRLLRPGAQLWYDTNPATSS